MGHNRDLNLKDLTLKIVILIALSSQKRMQTIVSLHNFFSKMSVYCDRIFEAVKIWENYQNSNFSNLKKQINKTRFVA